MPSTIAIIQADKNFAEQLSATLRQDGHIVLPSAHTLEDAYRNFSIYNADICVIDGSLPEETVARLSDMFTLMDVPHVINYNKDLLIRRYSSHQSLSSSSPAVQITEAKPPMAHAISLAVWELHVGLQITQSNETLSPAISYIAC